MEYSSARGQESGPGESPQGGKITTRRRDLTANLRAGLLVVFLEVNVTVVRRLGEAIHDAREIGILPDLGEHRGGPESAAQLVPVVSLPQKLAVTPPHVQVVLEDLPEQLPHGIVETLAHILRRLRAIEFVAKVVKIIEETSRRNAAHMDQFKRASFNL